MSVIQFKDLCVQYPNNEHLTINKMNLDVKEGEFIVLVGPSGCGKSTTLKVLSGLEDVASGEILINGNVVNYLEPKDRDIAMVFQNYALYPHFTVEKNISFGLRNLKVPKDEIKTRVDEVADTLGITDQMSKQPKDLSGGQQQRVALGRAIVRNPLIYIFDEPLSNLDAKLRAKTRDDIVKMHRDLKKTFIYVTHDQVEAMTMADRIVVLHDGIIQQVDKPINIFYNPVNLFVAKFMGTPEINIFDVKVVGGHFELANGYIFKSNSLCNQNVLDRKELIMGIRPDDIDYTFESTKECIKLYVFGREILGNQTILNCNAGEDEIDVVIKTSEYIENLENIYITVDPTKLYLFDKESEKNINVL
ncbi:MAG: ABC transporter ATP-binding protein [Mycoplasmatales bacterium]